MYLLISWKILRINPCSYLAILRALFFFWGGGGVGWGGVIFKNVSNQGGIFCGNVLNNTVKIVLQIQMQNV
jgi:hypothetical protein